MKVITAIQRSPRLRTSLALAAMAAFFGLSLQAQTVFTVKQTFTVKDLPEGAKKVKGWFWMPEDRPEQKVVDFKVVEAPQSLMITRDPQFGRSWLHAEVDTSGSPLKIVTEFKIVRHAVSGMADASKAGLITEEHRRTFATDLNPNEKHMEITPRIRKIADDLAAGEKNPVTLARRYFQYVIDKSDHYSKFGPMAKGKCLGSADECLAGSGDCCSDQHALFIALCRSQGIPCRMFFGSRLKPENEGKNHDPGYRCWPNFFAPNIGWIPLDISSADAAPAGKAGEWFGGLDANRLEWAEGRDFELEPRAAVRPDLVIRGWVEVDGKQHKGFDRVLHFTKQAAIASTPASDTTTTASR
ncbi:MAG: transglutaminase domain-containing protein [Verrucomicrobia bacterium]|nr:transglutaminase domain-containing protein [Verrucomicrobiota bacterium]